MVGMETYVIAAAAFTLAGIVKGVVGFGFPVISLIILTLTVGLLDALAIIVIPTIVTNIWQGLSGPWLLTILQRMWLYFATAMIFIWFTAAYLPVIDIKWPTALLGFVLVVFAVTRLSNLTIAVAPRWERPLSVPLGAINGVLTGMTGSFMVPSVIYMQAIGFRKDTLVQALGVFFAMSTAVLAASLGSNDVMNADHVRLAVLALIPSFAGLFLGRWLREGIDDEYFQRLFLVSVMLLGGYISIKALAYM